MNTLFPAASVRRLLLASTVGCICAGSAQAGVIYTDRTAFEAAVTGSSTKAFPASAVNTSPNPYTSSSVTFSLNNSGDHAILQDGGFGNAVYFANIGAGLSSETISSITNALGIYIGSMDGRQTFGFTFSGSTGTFTTPSEFNTSSFIGFTDSAPISVVFNTSSGKEFDITSFVTASVAAAAPMPTPTPVPTPAPSAVPEPASLAVLVAGAAGLGLMRRKRPQSISV